MSRLHTDMTEGSIARRLIYFAAPLFLGNLFQQLYNTADALIVGKMLGNSALAAVSSTGSLIFLLISLFEGISVGAGVLISRYYGAKDSEGLHRAIHCTVAFNLASGLVLTAFGTLMTPAILRWMATPEDVMELSVEYIRVYFAGSLGLVLYNGLRGIMQAIGNSRDPLIYLIISSCVNVVLDIAFIGLFHSGVAGAALATVISQIISVILCLKKLSSAKAGKILQFRKINFYKGTIGLIISYGLPAGLQNSVIAIANVLVQSNINAFGTMAVAGCGAYSKIEGFAFLPITSFVIAITTFVGQNLGAGNYQRAKKGAGFGILCSIALAELIGLAFYILAPWLISAFTQEPEAVAYGVEKARTCALFYCLLAASHSLAAVLRGAGKAVVPMAAMLLFWCLVRVSFISLLVPVYKDIWVVNWVYPFTWLLSSIFLAIYFFRADWIHSFEKNKNKEAQRVCR